MLLTDTKKGLISLSLLFYFSGLIIGQDFKWFDKYGSQIIIQKSNIKEPFDSIWFNENLTSKMILPDMDTTGAKYIFFLGQIQKIEKNKMYRLTIHYTVDTEDLLKKIGSLGLGSVYDIKIDKKDKNIILVSFKCKYSIL
jgi:hypothetical protein